MGFQRFKGPVIAVPCYGQQGGFHMFALDRAIKSAEAVDHGFQLGGHTIIVQWGSEHHHVSPQNFLADGSYIVLLYARTFISAVDAARAWMNVGVGYI